MKILFVCDQSRLRSPTAAELYGDRPGLETRAAGLASDALRPLTRDDLEWADLIFVMERRQRNVIHKEYRDIYESKRIICLYIPDEYDYMDPTLVRLLETRVGKHVT